MDAITQLFESYLTRDPRPIPQALAAQGLAMAIPAIADVVQDGSSRAAREKMAHAALLSGMALANSGLGFAHGRGTGFGRPRPRTPRRPLARLCCRRHCGRTATCGEKR